MHEPPRRTARALPGLVVALLLALPGLAQGGRAPRVKAYLSTGVVKLGDRVALVISVEGAKSSAVHALPQVDGLEIGPLGRPGDSQMITSINGYTTTSIERSWSVPVRPSAAGDYRIPPIEVEADGQTLHTPALSLTVVEDLRGADLGFFEIHTSSPHVVEGQPFSVELRFGWDQGIAERIDMANLSLPWWDDLPGVLAQEPDAARAGGRQVTLGLNGDGRVSAEQLDPQTVHGRTYQSYRVVRSFVPTRSGTLDFPTSFLEFGTRAREGLFFGQRSRGESYFVRAPAFAVDVVPLPEEGRPLDYGGAIGELELHASADPRDVDAGESIKLAVDVTGSGNLEFYTAPAPSRQEAFKGFRLFGKTEDKSFERRHIVYDLAPLDSSVTEIPPLRLPVFDPASSRYQVLQTDPIPIRVRPLEGAVALSAGDARPRFERDIQDIVVATLPPSVPRRPGPAGVLAALVLAPLIGLGTRVAVRRRRDPEAPLERRRRAARRELRRALSGARGPKEELDALHAWLAARTREADQAWVGRDVRAFAREGTGGWSGASADELAGRIRALEGAAYGGGASRDAAQSGSHAGEILALTDRLAKEGL